MNNSFSRTLRIFSTAIRLTADFRKAGRIQRRLEGAKRTAALERLYAQAGARLRIAALDLQGLIVKVGQFLSTRTDVLPLAFTRELAQLQDAVPPAPFAAIKTLIEHELGAHLHETFAEFEEQAIAAASLGQVHRARLLDGETVAVKVLRPDIEKLATIDLRALERVISVATRYSRIARRLNLTGLYREFREMVHQELDYRIEAANLKKFRENFANEKSIVIPRLYDPYTSRRVLVMEFITGAKITDVDTFTKWGVTPQTVVDLLIGAYLKQLLHDGLIHVDPHPGNLFVLEDGRLCFVDFGMMSELPKEHRRTFTKLVNGAVARNLDAVVEAIDDLGFLQASVNRKVLKQALGFILDRLSGIELKRGPELSQFVEDFQQFLYDEPITIQSKYMFLGRAIGLVSGLASSLYPEIRWLPLLRDRALPMLNTPLDFETEGMSGFQRFIRDAVKTVFGDAGATVSDMVFAQAKETGLSLIRNPHLLERVLHKAEAGELAFSQDFRELSLRMDRQERAISRLVWSILLATAGATGVYLHSRGDTVTANFAWSAMSLFALAFIINLLRSRRVKKNLKRRLIR